MAMASMRGLQMFITDVRNCQSKDQEMARVEKELNKIRMKFSYEKSLSSYEKKKYVWKLLYIHILGYQLDFGHREVLSLVGSHKYAEKQVGYMVAGCLLHENHEFLNLITKAIRLDIIGRSETYQCLALTMIGNIGGRDFAEALAPDVQKLVLSGSCRPLVRKKAILCLLHIYRKHPEVIQLDVWPDHIVNLLDERDYGVLLCVMTLLVALASNNPQQYYYCVSKCVRILERLLRSQSIPQDYTFYGIPSPWLQVKTMQALQLLPLLEDPSSVRLLLELLERVVIGTDITQSINRTNVMHAALFEAMELIMLIDTQQSLIPRCMVSLSKFVSLREPNLRCLGMRVLARLLSVADVRDNVSVYETDILFSLRDQDRSIQKVSVDLLYEICDATNVKRIVEEFLECFSTAEFDVQESIATKAGLLAEKYATDCSWYVDVVLLLVEKGGALVPDDVWRGLIQCVAKHDDIQVYAATKAREYISKPMVHETMLKIAGSLLGDNSHLLARKPGYTPKEIFWALHDKFSNVSTPTKMVLLSAYIKLLLHTQPADEELRKEIFPLFEKYGEHLEADLQQRAMGFFSLSQQDQNISNEEPKRQEAPVKSSRDYLPGTSTARAPEVDLLGDLVAPQQNDPFQTGITKDPFSSMLAPAVQPTGNLIEWFNSLCYKDTGILYEDPYVQIGIKAQYQGSRGEINFYLGNKQSETLTSVRAIILPQPHLRVEFPGAPPSIQAAEQIQVLLKVACLYAGRIAPLLDFSYMVSGMTVSVKLRIPIVISKFLQPATLSANDFFSAWRALVTAPNKLQEVIRGLQYSTVSEFSDKLNGLRIGVATGLEPNPNNLVSASSFHSETGGALLCMVRIETDPADKTQLRLTVASPNSRLALELKEFLKEQLPVTLPTSTSPVQTAMVPVPPVLQPVLQPVQSVPAPILSAPPITAMSSSNLQAFPTVSTGFAQKPLPLSRSFTTLAMMAGQNLSSSNPLPPMNVPAVLNDPLADLFAPSDFAALAKPSASSSNAAPVSLQEPLSSAAVHIPASNYRQENTRAPDSIDLLEPDTSAEALVSNPSSSGEQFTAGNPFADLDSAPEASTPPPNAQPRNPASTFDFEDLL